MRGDLYFLSHHSFHIYMYYLWTSITLFLKQPLKLNYFSVKNTCLSSSPTKKAYCRTHNLGVCLYIAYIACCSASRVYKNAVFFFCTLALSASATAANIKIRYDAKTPQFAIFGIRVICVFYCLYQHIKDILVPLLNLPATGMLMTHN